MSTYYFVDVNEQQLKTDAKLQTIAKKLINKLAAAYNKKYGLKLPTDVEVVFDLELRKPTCAGTATSRINAIDLNMTMFRDNVHEFLNGTIPHEVAHLAQFLYNDKHMCNEHKHGWVWEKMMLGMKQQPLEFHSMSTQKAQEVYKAHRKQVK